MENTLWIHIHPLRTGGATILNTIRAKIPMEERFEASDARYNLYPKTFDKKKLRFMLGHATYYGIHNLVPDKKPRYFVFLRDPAEKIVSYYNAKMLETKKIIPFDEWYFKQMRNDMVHFLDLKYKGSPSSRTPVPSIFMPIIRRLNYKTFFFLQSIALKFVNKSKNVELKKLENAKKLLDLCWFVGIIENSDKDIPFLFDSMGLKNAEWKKTTLPKKILKLGDKLRERIYKDNPLDVEIYQYALKLNKEKRPIQK